LSAAKPIISHHCTIAMDFAALNPSYALLALSVNIAASRFESAGGA